MKGRQTVPQIPPTGPLNAGRYVEPAAAPNDQMLRAIEDRGPEMKHYQMADAPDGSNYRTAMTSAQASPLTVRRDRISSSSINSHFSPSTGGTFSMGGGSNSSSYNESLKARLLEIRLVLQKIAGLGSSSTIALAEVAELLCQYLGMSLVSVAGVVPESSNTFVQLSTYGMGAEALRAVALMAGPQWSGSRVLGSIPALCLNVDSDADVAALPADWAAVYRSAGLRSFLGVPICTNCEVFGVLTVAKHDSHAFDLDTWEPVLGLLAVGLLVYLKHEHVRSLISLMQRVAAAPGHLSLIAMLLHGAHDIVLQATNMRTNVRLALLRPDLTQALMFEVHVKAHGAARAGARPPTAGSPLDDVRITAIPLKNTLLLDAVLKGKARFVSDCTLYLQQAPRLASDIFLSGSAAVASVVVLPLMHGSVTFGGVYFTLDQPHNFANMRELLLGFVSHMVPLLHSHLGSCLADVWAELAPRAGVERVPSDGMDRQPSGAAGMEPPSPQPAAASASSGTDPGVRASYVQRSATEGILKVLQNEIWRSRAKLDPSVWVTSLELDEVLGSGGFGTVYRGRYKGAPAAVKVMYARQHERQAMKDALEMAVLTSVSHPNVVQVFACFTDMVEDNDSKPPDGLAGGAATAPRFRRLAAGEDPSLASCNVVVMELCDLGSLRHAMKRGVFHAKGEQDVPVPQFARLLQVLLETAHALAHLHSLKLIHCDIKPENVLLKSDSCKASGFTAKLSDFGLAKMLRENLYIVNRSGSGTVTHLAPEVFQVGSKLTTAVDAFSFGIMMWEIYTGQRAYQGMNRDVIMDRVYNRQIRPIFPEDAPEAYTSLVSRCWDNDPKNRPSFDEVIVQLEAMRDNPDALKVGTKSNRTSISRSSLDKIPEGGS